MLVLNYLPETQNLQVDSSQNLEGTADSLSAILFIRTQFKEKKKTSATERFSAETTSYLSIYVTLTGLTMQL